MSQENVELARRLVGAWNRRDLEAILALTDPDVEYVNSPTAVEPGIRWGHQRFTDVLRAQWEILSDARWEVDRVYERREGMIGLGRISRQMPGSDARIEDRVLVALRFESGRVTRMEILGFGQAEVGEQSGQRYASHTKCIGGVDGAALLSPALAPEART
jgi:ketosteroid isomerase-like protein